MTRRLTYSLTGSAGSDDPVALRTCPRCFRVVLASRQRCPECQAVFADYARERELPQTVAGVLEEYHDPDVAAAAVVQPPAKRVGPRRDAPPADRERFWLALCAEAAVGQIPASDVTKFYKQEFGVLPVVVRADGADHLCTEASGDAVKRAAWAAFAREPAGWGKPWWPWQRFRFVFGHQAEAWHRDPRVARPASLFAAEASR